MASVVVSSQTLPSADHIGVPRLIRFRGLLRDGLGQPFTGEANVSFSIYSEPDGGTPLWKEVQKVQFSEGHYSILLGSASQEGIPPDLFRSAETWLGVHVLLDGEQERPRTFLTSVPYALKALDAETLGGLPVSAFVRAANQTSPDPDPTTITSVQSANGLLVRSDTVSPEGQSGTIVPGRSTNIVSVNGIKYPTVQAAIGALPPSGGTINLPCGTYAGPTNIPSGVWINSLCQPINPTVSIGGAMAPSYTNGTVLIYNAGLTIANRFGIGLNNVLLDFSRAGGRNLTLAGVSHSYFRIAVRCPLGSSGGTCVNLTDGGSVGRNMMFNKFDLLWTFGGNISLRLAGTSLLSRAVTNNVFSSVILNQPYQRGLDFAQYCDSNTFEYVFINPWNVASPYSPVILNSASATTDVDVESIQIRNITIGAPNSGTCNEAIAFNLGYGNSVFASEIGGCSNVYAAKPGATFLFTEGSRDGTSGSPPEADYVAPDFTDVLYLRGSTPSSTRSPNLAFCDPDAHCFHQRKDGRTLLIVTPSNGSYAFPDTASNVRISGIISASFSTTASTTDDVEVTGITATGHCFLQPTNSAAALGFAEVYISNKTRDQITISHPASSGWTFDVLCTP